MAYLRGKSMNVLIWIMIYSATINVCTTQYSFYAYDEGIRGWTSIRCNEDPPREIGQTTIIDFHRNYADPCTCLLYRTESWDSDDEIRIERYIGGDWEQIMTLSYSDWDQKEGGALRVNIVETDVEIFLNNENYYYRSLDPATLKLSGVFSLRCSDDAAFSFTSPGQEPTTTTTSTTTTTTTESTERPTVRTPSTTSSTATRDPSLSTTPNSDSEPSSKDDDNTMLKIIIVCVGAGVLTLVVILIVCVVVRRRKRNKTEKNRVVYNSKEADVEEDRGSSGYHSSVALTSTSSEDNNDTEIKKSEEPLYQNTKLSPRFKKAPVPQKSPPVSMDTRHSDREEYDSANDSTGTDEEKSSANETDAHNFTHSSNEEETNLHPSDVEFSGRKNRVFRKDKRHKKRSTILRNKNPVLSDSDTESLHEDGGNTRSKGDQRDTEGNNENSGDDDEEPPTTFAD